MVPRSAASLLLVTLAVSVALGAPAAAAHPGARPGEAYTFKFTVGPVEGGRARMSIGRPMAQNGKRVVWVHGEAETTAFVRLLANVKDDYKLSVDLANLLPLSVAENERGLRERHITSTVDGRVADVDYWAPDKQLKGRRVLPRIVRDPLSGYFALRALPLNDGQQIGLDVLDGAALWRVVLTVARGQRLLLEGGGAARNAIRIDGLATRIEDNGRPRARMAPRPMTIWLSDDADRVLLRLEAETELGKCALELTSYQPPTRVAAEKSPQLPGIETR